MNEPNPKPIACDLYDYIEIACLYRLPVRLEPHGGKAVEGVALDTARNADHAECIKIAVQPKVELVVLTDVARMTALTENPHFDSVKIS